MDDSKLLPTPVVNDMGAGKTPPQWDVWIEQMRVKHGNGNGHGRSLSVEVERAVALLPTPTVQQGRNKTSGRQPDAKFNTGTTLNDTVYEGTINEVNWGPYEVAIRRWEATLNQPAPAPTELGKEGRPRLSPRFVEWMMGLPDGWVCDVPDISRTQQLKLLGNGVVPQQAVVAIEHLLHVVSQYVTVQEVDSDA